MIPLYTDGARWYRLPDGVLLLPGPLTLTGIDGSQRAVQSGAVAAYGVSAEAAMGLLVDGLWDDAEPTVAVVLEALTGLLESEGDLLRGMQRAMAAAGQPEGRAFQHLCAQAQAVGSTLGGAAGDAVAAFPGRLAASIARKRLGESGAGGVLAEVEDDARALLAGLIASGPRQAMRQAPALLAPRPADLAAVFSAELAPRMQAHYAAIFSRPVAPVPGRSGTTRFVAATIADIRDQTVRGQAFPRQYARLVDHLREGPIWVRWWWGGTAWDGLVRLPERWVWLPKPWRAL